MDMADMERFTIHVMKDCAPAAVANAPVGIIDAYIGNCSQQYVVHYQPKQAFSATSFLPVNS